MSYTTGTTHYNLPQTVGSDKRDWTDTNEAFSDVDAALWESHQGVTQAALDIASINSEIQTITGKQADDEADIATISGKVSTLETTVGNHTTEIGDVRRDLQDNIESLREDTATSTHAYEIGDYFYYNDVLFKATAQIAIGATIVPNTNCTGVTVMDELKNGGAVSIDASEVTYGSSNVEDALDDKIDTFSGSVADASQNTYTAVTADGIAYDATNDQLLLKVNGADTVIPFKKGGEMPDSYISAGSNGAGSAIGLSISGSTCGVVNVDRNWQTVGDFSTMLAAGTAYTYSIRGEKAGTVHYANIEQGQTTLTFSTKTITAGEVISDQFGGSGKVSAAIVYYE